MTKIKLSDLKIETGIGFGTSGIRGLATELTDKVIYSYTTAFLNHTKSIGDLKNEVAIAGDLRDSTDRILISVCRACNDFGLKVTYCGKIPSPALAYFGVVKGMPSIMVTGSHIPGDRNGVKFNLSQREVLKSDEALISNSEIEYDDALLNKEIILPEINTEAKQLYIDRYLSFFPENLLGGKTIGVYGHSAVGRNILTEILEKLGAKVIKIEYSDVFIPIDTEAVSPQLVENLKKWHKEFNCDCIVSTDGDSDRPLLTNNLGDNIRPDILPIICGKYLGIEAMACAVSCNSSVDKSGLFKKVVKTKIGSPYVIEAMLNLVSEGYKKVASFEGNGGFLLATDINLNNKTLSKLPTRDAILVILAVLAESITSKKNLQQLFDELPKRSTYSSSIKGIPTEISLKILESWEDKKVEIESTFGKIININDIDGLRLTFENEEIVHFRPSKNAPEFRNYTEAVSLDRAMQLSEMAIELIKKWTE